MSTRNTDLISRGAILVLTLLALGLRLWKLDVSPPGWRDDELINSLVISQKPLDGIWAFYYPDASGHEALYHVLNALMLKLFGPSIPGIRWLSVILGTLAVPMTWLLGKRLFGPVVGLTAAAGLTFSFWSLMYSRIGLRHILAPLLALTAFFFFWKAITDKHSRSAAARLFLLAAFFLALGFYTYFASRGVPLILLAFCIYWWIFAPGAFHKNWSKVTLMFVTAAVMALPLIISLNQQQVSDARVAELAVPLVEARTGNFQPLWDHVRITLSMFHSTGDGEWLYNIPNRPVFGLIGALFFWSGVAIAFWHALTPVRLRLKQRGSIRATSTSAYLPLSLASTFLLLWWLAGISPGFISVPPASLGHAIIAQPAVYILAALPLRALSRVRWSLSSQWLRQAILLAAGLLLLFSIAWRDLPDYYLNWPERGMVRFLYRADIHEVAAYLNNNPDLQDFGITGLLAGPWDGLALTTDLIPSVKANVKPRWYNPERAILLQPSLSFSGFPNVEDVYAGRYQSLPGHTQAGGYQLRQVERGTSTGDTICFVNGLCSVTADYDAAARRLELVWEAERSLDLPPMPLISNPPPPGVYAGPRLQVFAQLLDANDNFLVGDDGLWVDPTSLHPGDLFMQQHYLFAPENSEPTAILFGLYDPLTNERILTEDGRSQLRLELGE